LVLMAGDPQTFEFPPYTANLIVSEDIDAAMAAGPSFVERVFAALRPYGGTACFAATDDRHAKLADWVKRLELPGGDLRRADGLTVLVRKGPLPGAADWTHERRDQANTICTPDTAIRPPMGLLWWGGPAAEWRRCYIAFIPPGLEVVDGRYIMQGHGLLSAVDVYTGRLLWEKDIPRLQYYGAYIEEFMRDGNGNPLYPEPDSEAWRKGHEGLLPGEIEIAKLSGNAFNVVSMPDAIYMTVAEKLWAIDPDTGETVRTFDFPFKDPQARRPLCWGNLRIEGDVIVATAFDPQDIRDSFGAWFQGNEKNKQRMQMRWLMAVNRRTGKLLWKRRAAGGFLNHAFALGNGRVFCVDAVSQPVMEAYEKVGRKLTPAQPSVQALDLTSGVQLWHKPLDVYVPTINYSVPRDILLLPARSSTCWEDGRWVSRETPAGKGKKAGDSVVLAWRGKDGKLLWQAKDLQFAEPVMMCRDMLISRHGNTLNLLDGKPIRRPDPLTGQVRAWGPSAGGCNFLIGSEYLSTHRICYDDLRYQCTVPLPGMRSGCTPSILPANGAMTVFNYSGNYPSDELRSAYVLIHRPQNANYTSFGAGRGADSIQRFLSAGLPARRLGLNFGAPGDLMGLDGTP
ncbi:MAG: PQQ-binding-like beta-propeller repeat protein, partial [Phycisphaerae bacterium]